MKQSRADREVGTRPYPTPAEQFPGIFRYLSTVTGRQLSQAKIHQATGAHQNFMANEQPMFFLTLKVNK